MLHKKCLLRRFTENSIGNILNDDSNSTHQKLHFLFVLFIQVVNFYFNLIQDRSGKDGLPPVYVFNTFYYPKIMKDGHKGVRRWTKAVDIFSKDLILVPIHLGMHWCLAVSTYFEFVTKYRL